MEYISKKKLQHMDSLSLLYTGFYKQKQNPLSVLNNINWRKVKKYTFLIYSNTYLKEEM